MAILSRMSREEIKSKYDHYGYFMGLVPIYIGDIHHECRVAVRNWFPDFLLDIALFACDLMPCDYFAIKQTGRIK